jgi:glycosyltransferase involved in cell wall biosynthesis
MTLPADGSNVRSPHRSQAKKGDLISVIIPVRNGERFIERTLESVLRQTYTEIEVIVVDDGSTDRTSAIVEKVAARDTRVALFSGPHAGVAAARNTALSHARGAFVAPVDADDLWREDKLALQVEAIRRAGSGVGVVYCWSVAIDEADNVCSRTVHRFQFEGNVLAPLLETNFLGNASSPLIRRVLLEAIGGYGDPGFNAAEDWKLYLMLAGICEFALVRHCLVGYRKSPTSVSANFENMRGAINRVRHWARERWPSIPARHWRRERYFSNHQLANLALRHGSIGKAAVFHIRSIAAWPPASTYVSTAKFSLRLAARMVGIGWFPRAGGTPESFWQFSERFNSGAKARGPRRHHGIVRHWLRKQAQTPISRCVPPADRVERPND